MRIFAGIPLPAPVIDRLSTLRLRLAGPRDGLRWSAPEQWHITLRFFGELQAENLPHLVRALGDLQISPLQLRIERLGAFPAKGILFAELVNSRELSEFQAQVESLAEHCGIPRETRPYHPHVTLARSRNAAGLAAMRKLTSPEPPDFGSALSWVADRLWLYESELQAGGAKYRTLADLALRSGSD